MQTATHSYDAADRITDAGFTYDGRGNLTSDGNRHFTYDAANRLTLVKSSAGTTLGAYAYDAFNRRISATEGTLTTYFHYQGVSANVIAETDEDGNTIASYTYGVGGSLHSMTRDGETYYYHLNGHGDVVALTDAAGSVVASYSYDPWGRPLTASGTVTNPYRYAGYRYDAPTGLYYTWNRHYVPELGRFLQRDLAPAKLSNPSTLNRYAYCGADPVNKIDPTGLWCWDTGAFLAGVAVTILLAALLAPLAIAVAGALALSAGTLMAIAAVGAVVAAGGVFWYGTGVVTGHDPLGNPVTAKGASYGLGASVTGLVMSVVGLVSSAGAAGGGVAAEAPGAGVGGGVDVAYHHTVDARVDSIAANGLIGDSFATPTELGPLQAHIELALDPLGGARNSIFRIDVGGLRSAGYAIPEVTRVTGAYGMAGGGWEMQFPYPIPPEFLGRVQ